MVCSQLLEDFSHNYCIEDDDPRSLYGMFGFEAILNLKVLGVASFQAQRHLGWLRSWAQKNKVWYFVKSIYVWSGMYPNPRKLVLASCHVHMCLGLTRSWVQKSWAWHLAEPTCSWAWRMTKAKGVGPNTSTYPHVFGPNRWLTLMKLSFASW